MKRGQIVEHPYKIGDDNQPLKGTITDIPNSNYRYWLILWDGEHSDEPCERCDFIIRRKSKKLKDD